MFYLSCQGHSVLFADRHDLITTKRRLMKTLYILYYWSFDVFLLLNFVLRTLVVWAGMFQVGRRKDKAYISHSTLDRHSKSRTAAPEGFQVTGLRYKYTCDRPHGNDYGRPCRLFPRDEALASSLRWWAWLALASGVWRGQIGLGLTKPNVLNLEIRDQQELGMCENNTLIFYCHAHWSWSINMEQASLLSVGVLLRSCN